MNTAWTVTPQMHGPRLKWSGRTNQGASSGPAGQCKVATVGPSLP